MKFLLDTNICIEHLRGKMDIWPFVSERGQENCFLSEVVVAELKIGQIILEHKGCRVRQNLDDFLSQFQILPISPVIDFFAEEKCRLQFAGTPQHNNFDLLIGCTAVCNDMVVVTDNIKDFKNIKGIQIEDWIAMNRI